MTMNSKKVSLTLGMVAALTLAIAIIFASPLSATTNMDGGMMMSPQSSGGIPGQSGTLQPVPVWFSKIIHCFVQPKLISNVS